VRGRPGREEGSPVRRRPLLSVPGADFAMAVRQILEPRKNEVLIRVQACGVSRSAGPVPAGAPRGQGFHPLQPVRGPGLGPRDLFGAGEPIPAKEKCLPDGGGHFSLLTACGFVVLLRHQDVCTGDHLPRDGVGGQGSLWTRILRERTRKGVGGATGTGRYVEQPKGESSWKPTRRSSMTRGCAGI